MTVRPRHHPLEPKQLLTPPAAFGGSGNWADEVEETYGKLPCPSLWP